MAQVAHLWVQYHLPQHCRQVSFPFASHTWSTWTETHSGFSCRLNVKTATRKANYNMYLYHFHNSSPRFYTAWHRGSCSLRCVSVANRKKHSSTRVKSIFTSVATFTKIQIKPKLNTDCETFLYIYHYAVKTLDLIFGVESHPRKTPRFQAENVSEFLLMWQKKNEVVCFL